MQAFLGKRVVRAVLTLWVVLTLVFVGTRLSGNTIDFIMPEGSDAESRQAMIAYLGLDRSLVVQYGIYLREVLQGDFGLSFYQRRPVTQMYLERLGPSLSLYGAALALSILVGVPLGVVAALRRETLLARGIMTGAFLGYAVPNFVLAILLLLVFSFHLHWLPSSGFGGPAHYVMPTLAVASVLLAALVRFTRSATLDVLSADYLRTARSKGLSERAVMMGHALRNALITVITIVGLQVTTVVATSVIIEVVFAWPGIGELLVLATIGRDYPALQFGVVTIAAVVILVNLGVDLLYALADPRIRFSD